MRFFFKNINFVFSVSNIGILRKSFQYNMCYKEKYKFLKLKATPVKALTNRFIKRGNFLKIYKLLKRFFYISMLRNRLKSVPIGSNFLFFYHKYYSFRDLDRVLYWKYMSLDCMFSNKTRKLNKKKKYQNSLVFITGIKRILLCINFLKYGVLLTSKRKKKNMSFKFFNVVRDYIVNDRDSFVLKVKYRLYKQKLMKLQN